MLLCTCTPLQVGCKLCISSAAGCVAPFWARLTCFDVQDATLSWGCCQPQLHVRQRWPCLRHPSCCLGCPAYRPSPGLPWRYHTIHWAHCSVRRAWLHCWLQTDHAMCGTCGRAPALNDLSRAEYGWLPQTFCPACCLDPCLARQRITWLRSLQALHKEALSLQTRTHCL